MEAGGRDSWKIDHGRGGMWALAFWGASAGAGGQRLGLGAALTSPDFW